MFTIIGADTSVYVAFAVQWLFVFFNSFQGFFLFVFFVILNRDARKLWLVWFSSCLRIEVRAAFVKTFSTTGNTSSTKLKSEKQHEINTSINTKTFDDSLCIDNNTIDMKDIAESCDADTDENEA